MATGRFHALAQDYAGLLKFFETIYFHETTEEETLLVLLDFVRRLERKQVVFTLPALLSIITQSSRYKWEVPFPERALDLAEETLTYWQGNSDEAFVTPQTVEAFVSLQTGVPTGAIGSDEKDKLLRLEELLHKRVIGQDEAVKQVAEAMRRARAGFGDAKRPLGSFIFLGPTGVGKTETVKAFAESYFGDETRMIRLDMSEYQTPEAVSRLIGSEAIGVSGQLTDLVKEKPFSILLLDELEKAYPKALDLFLQILDEGFVTDSAGEKISFRNTIIIATSNAGAPLIKESLEQGMPLADVRKRVMDYIVEQGIYRLEFLNRFDGVIFFEPLSQEELLQVTNMKLESFSARLKKEKNITIEFAPGVAEKIVAKGYQPEFGARSINRYIEDTIEDVVIGQIIAGSATAGSVLSVTADQL
jgi:ATP-dependent Clp protease ATP-binding subunit ClpA